VEIFPSTLANCAGVCGFRHVVALSAAHVFSEQKRPQKSLLIIEVVGARWLFFSRGAAAMMLSILKEQAFAGFIKRLSDQDVFPYPS